MLQRWQTHWNWLFYALLTVSTGLAAADANSDHRRAAIIVLAAGLAVWHWAAVVRGGRFALGAGVRAIPGLMVAAALWVALLLLHPLFQLLMFSAYHLACSTPAPLRRSIPGIGAVSALVVATQAIRQGHVEPFQLVFYGGVTVALGLLVAMTHAIQEQSEERGRLIAQLEATRERLAASERRAGALAERQRLAGEIHDTLAQGFASIVTLYEAARAELGSGPEDGLRRLEEMGSTARANLTEARRVVWALQPGALEDGSLASAFDQLADSFRAETGIDARSMVNGAPGNLDPETEATLLRVAQEALANVRKHARATRVTLTLTYLDDSLLLDVRDDGIGFDPGLGRRDGRQDGGFGLPAMRERLARRGGSLTIESAAGAGTTIAAALPMTPAASTNGEAHPYPRIGEDSGAP